MPQFLLPAVLLQSGGPSPNLPYLFAAFAVSWLVFFGYAFFMSRRQRELRNEIARLQRLVDADAAAPPPPPSSAE